MYTLVPPRSGGTGVGTLCVQSVSCYTCGYERERRGASKTRVPPQERGNEEYTHTHTLHSHGPNHSKLPPDLGKCPDRLVELVVGVRSRDLDADAGLTLWNHRETEPNHVNPLLQ